MDFKITTDAQKTIKSIKGDGFSLFGYEERDFLNQKVEKFFSKESGVLFSSAEETQLKERGYLKSLPKNFLSGDKHIIPIDLGVEINPLEGGLKTDLIFTIHRERKNNKNEVLLRLQNNALEKLAAGKPLIEKNRSEENLKLYAQELQQNNEELKNFTFVASHDLKEPLRKINLFCDQLLEKNLDQKKRDNFIERIGKASIRMYHLTDDLYNWASIGRMATDFNPEDMNEIVQEVIDDLEGSIKETDAKIKIDDLPTLEVEKIKIHQLFQNLLSNAMKFHREGVSPEIQITSRCTGDGYCEIDIQDNGIGIDEKYYKKIFEPFSRLNNKNDYIGSGIGLAICEKIISRHQGEIVVNSSLQIGTKITLRLPSQQTIDE